MIKDIAPRWTIWRSWSWQSMDQMKNADIWTFILVLFWIGIQISFPEKSDWLHWCLWLVQCHQSPWRSLDDVLCLVDAWLEWSGTEERWSGLWVVSNLLGYISNAFCISLCIDPMNSSPCLFLLFLIYISAKSELQRSTWSNASMEHRR